MRELDVIESIRKWSDAQNPLLSLGIGDDCAIFAKDEHHDWIVSTDLLVENVHFDRRWHPPELLGRKSLAVNLSDIAAMAGKPIFILMSIALSQHIDNDWLHLFLKGFSDLAREHSCVLIGGDTCAGPIVTVSVTVLGTVPRGKAILRSGAGVGDIVYVSGFLGSAAAGLHICQHENTYPDLIEHNRWNELVQCHLNPHCEIEYAQQLAVTGAISAMQDISDGIATDLGHICKQSGIGARIFADKIPAHPQLVQYCTERKLDPLDFQLKGGEDCQLVFTVKKEFLEGFERKIVEKSGRRPWRIGEIVAGNDVILIDDSGHETTITFQGYEHVPESAPQEE